MEYLVKEVRSAELIEFIELAVKENGAIERIRKAGMSTAEFFAHCDKRAREEGALHVVYLALCDAEDSRIVGWARVVHETTLPGYNSLPTDHTVICIDDIWLLPEHRHKGGFAVLIDRIRVQAISEWGAVYVYARVLDYHLQSAFLRYGMGKMPLFVGTLSALKLPAPEKHAKDSGDWSVDRRGRWHSDMGGADELGREAKSNRYDAKAANRYMRATKPGSRTNQ